MSYGKVYDVFWEDDKIEQLSDRAALLALFLITGPHRNAIGCFRLGKGAITDVPRFGAWGIEGASEALQELIDIGFIVRDERSGWTFIVNALKHDPIKQDKAAVHALMLFERVPKNTNVYHAVTEKLEPQLKAHSKALADKEGWPIVRPSEGPPKAQPSPSPLPSPSPEPSPKGSVSNETGAGTMPDLNDEEAVKAACFKIAAAVGRRSAPTELMKTGRSWPEIYASLVTAKTKADPPSYIAKLIKGDGAPTRRGRDAGHTPPKPRLGSITV